MGTAAPGSPIRRSAAAGTWPCHIRFKSSPVPRGTEAAKKGLNQAPADTISCAFSPFAVVQPTGALGRVNGSFGVAWGSVTLADMTPPFDDGAGVAHCALPT